jgi:hypothetical protein
VGAALDGDGDLPVNFGDLFDDPSEGGEPGWDVWQTAVGDGAKIPQEVQANLPPDVRDRLDPTTGDTGGAGDGTLPGGNEGAPESPGAGGVVPGVGPGGLDVPIAPGPDYPGSVAEADLGSQGGIGGVLEEIGTLVETAPDLSQASETFDTARNDQAIRQAELTKAQSEFDTALTQWLSVNHEYIQAREALQDCQGGCNTRQEMAGVPGCSCGAEAAEEARLDEELRLASVELETLEVALGEAQIQMEVANSSVENAEIHYENISNIIENRY